MISGTQCRAARAMLEWSQDKLTEKAALPPSFVEEFESDLRSGPRKEVLAIQNVFDAEGLMFREGGVARRPLRESLRRAERQVTSSAQPAEDVKLADMENHDLITLRISLNTEMQVLKKQQETIKKRITSISNELRRRNSVGENVEVSEHAVMRYLQRIHGINVKSVRRKIREAIPATAVRGDKFDVDGITYVISHAGYVTTLYETEEEQSVDVLGTST